MVNDKSYVKKYFHYSQIESFVHFHLYVININVEDTLPLQQTLP